MEKLKEWIKSLNTDLAWQDKVERANSIRELENLAVKNVQECGWLNLSLLKALLS